MTATDARAAVLAAALPHVPFDGWTRKALEAGAVDAGFPAEDAAWFFPGGPAEAVELHSRLADAAMADALAAMDPPPERLRDKVAALIRLRLEGAEKDREAVRLGLGLLAQPRHAARGLKALARTADAIWRAVGDRSADFNWYSKRGIVATVYMATVAYWLNDRSPGHADSWAFLDRRLDTAIKAPMQAKAAAKKAFSFFPRPGRIASELKRRRAAGGW